MLSTGEDTNPDTRHPSFMDTPLPENRPNLLVYVAAGAGVFALILGIVGLMQISNIKKQLGTVDLVALEQSVSNASSAATAASTEASKANSQRNPAIQALSAAMEREIGNQLNAIRNDIQRVEELARQAAERPSSVASSGGSSSSASGGPTGGGDTGGGQLGDDGTYVIKPGDTYGKIAPQFGVTVAEIVAANPGVDPRRLRVGQRIVIPRR